MMKNTPLAEILRAQTLDDIVGQDHLVGKNGILTKIIHAQKPLSLLLWGPPGVGKTSIARLYARAFSFDVVSLSATNASVADVKKIIAERDKAPLLRPTIMMFMDEIHRFNKAQQDAFLPHLEDGSIILIGATTENPSFYLNGALLSRMRVLTLNALNDEALLLLINRFLNKVQHLTITDDAKQFLVAASRGDGRCLFNLLQNVLVGSEQELTREYLEELLPKGAVLYDRGADQHYNLISALHKAIRSSDPDAALYCFPRMLQGGEEPLFLARRLIRMASEDIGLADPNALTLAVAARDSYQMLGSPEGELSLAEVVVYLALAPKSNALYVAFKKAKHLAETTAHLNPPKHILNAPTRLMKNLGYGAGYVYDHDTDSGCSGANSFPDEITRTALYQPAERGFEREMAKRLRYFDAIRKQMREEK